MLQGVTTASYVHSHYYSIFPLLVLCISTARERFPLLKFFHCCLKDKDYSNGKYEVPTVQGVSTTSAQTASVQVSTASTDVAAASLSYDTVCAFIATQPNGSQIKFEDITQIDDDDIEEIDIKWNLDLLSMRVDRWNASIAIRWAILLESDSITQRVKTVGRRKLKKDPKVEEDAPKAMIAIDGIGWDWSYMAEEDENHDLVADEEEVPTEYALMAKSSSSSDNEMGLLEFVDETVTDYSRSTPSVDVSKDVSTSSIKQGGSFDNVVSKPMIRFVKETGYPSVSKVKNTENSKKPNVKYAEMYRNTPQSPKVMSSNFGPPIIEDWDSEDER
ncbi:hypothetical protein Tco_0291614 [Tanacetum coccineum]